LTKLILAIVIAPRAQSSMIRHPLGLRLAPDHSIRDQIYEAARMGARGVVLDAVGDLAPHRLGETGRRDLRHILRTVELSLIALALPTRRPFDTSDQLEDRLRRAEAAFAMAFELGTTLVLVRAGAIPPAEDAARHEVFKGAIGELARRADHRGTRCVLETGPEPGRTLKAFLDALGSPGLAASVDPAGLLQAGIDPVTCVRELEAWVAHAYVNDATGGAGTRAPNPRGYGFPPGALDWEEYLGALEEVGYHGFLTVLPASGHPAADQFAAVRGRLERLA
jgi:sugar phosphate isomerase/epimerase